MWHDGASERGVVRRRIDDSLELMNGGYRDLVTGRARPRRRRVQASRDNSRAAVKGRVSSSLPPEDADLFTEPETDVGSRAMIDTKPRYLDTRRAAAYLGISPSTLNRMRVSGDGPRYSKLGRRVVYDIADLDAWVEERKRRFTAESTGA